uniref:Uncharacterized protein n=1 Tax=candidate division CPR3 bacterium TaxID=2268181 RepID=A0A7V3JAS8_UNCC3
MKNWVIAVAIVVILAVGAGCWFYITNKHQREIEAQGLIYDDLVKEIDNLHKDFGNLLISSSSKDILTREASKVCQIAEDTRDEITKLKSRVQVIGATLALQDAVEKSDKYIGGFPDFIHGRLTKDRLVERAEVMLECLDNSRISLNKISSIDKSDTGAAIDRVVLLVNNLKRANKPSAAQLTEQPVYVVSSPYWANPLYAGYRENIRDIVASYSAGRRILSRVLANYDRGRLTDQDRADWLNELNRRRVLISELDAIERNIPPGSIYQEHHRLLTNMLKDATEAMERFAAYESPSSRRYLSAISNRNTALMNRLKNFYGIR